MPVNSEHPEYTANKEKWSTVRKVVKSEAKDEIIPPIFISGNNQRRKLARNQKYIDMAVFDNFTIETLVGLVGTSMMHPPVIELPPELEYMKLEATGNKLRLDQLTRLCISEDIQLGRVGILTDFPAVEEGLSDAEVKILDPKPKMYVKIAEDIKNWDVDTKSGSEQLNFVVLREVINVRVDGFKWESGVQYKVLQLDAEGNYFYEILDDAGKVAQAATYPKQNGKLIDHIPFRIAGSENNDSSVDISPLYPIAHVNLGHYRNSANLEDNADAHGQGSLFLTSSMSTSSFMEHLKKHPMDMSSREGTYLGQDGKAILLQLQPNQLVKDMMTQKEEQMIMMGAHLMTPANANAPVETTRMQMGSKISRLDTIVTNVEDAINESLRDCALWLGANPDLVNYELSHDFIPESADATVMRELAAQWTQGLVSKNIVRAYDRKVGLISRDKTDEEIDQDINEESPLGNTLPEDEE